MKRRNFMRQSALLTAGSMALINCRSKSKEVASEQKFNFTDIGVQTYTVRDDMKNDLYGTLKAIADIGYSDVECDGYREGAFYGLSPLAFKNLLSEYGLKMNSGHTESGYLSPEQNKTLVNNWESACEDFVAVGQKAVFCGYLHAEERKTMDDYKRFAEVLNRCGETAKQYGLIFGHHNHDFELLELDGQIPYEYLLKETNPEHVFFELDLYWTEKAGYNTVELIKNNPGRFPYWHIKDMTADEEKYFTEVGNGIIDFKSIFEYANLAGLQHFYVEQDHCRNNTPLESIQISYNYLKNI